MWLIKFKVGKGKVMHTGTKISQLLVYVGGIWVYWDQEEKRPLVSMDSSVKTQCTAAVKSKDGHKLEKWRFIKVCVVSQTTDFTDWQNSSWFLSSTFWVFFRARELRKVLKSTTFSNDASFSTFQLAQSRCIPHRPWWLFQKHLHGKHIH